MSQTSYNQTYAKGYEGMLADSRIKIVETYQATEALKPGRAVVKVYGEENQCRLPAETQSVILDSAGTFTAGDIVTTVNGTEITTAFDTDKDTTMTAHAAAIQAGVADVYSAVYASGAHTITIKTRNTAVVATVDVSGITGTMTITSVTASSLDVAADVRGLAVNPGNIEQDANGLVTYAATDAVSVLTQGALYVLPEETVTPDSAVYVRMQANGTKLPGMFGASSDSGKCVLLPGARWVEGGTTTTVAKLVINLPQ